MPASKKSQKWQERIHNQSALPAPLTRDDKIRLKTFGTTPREQIEPFWTRPMVVKINGVYRQISVD
jgi:hypothetical protein